MHTHGQLKDDVRGELLSAQPEARTHEEQCDNVVLILAEVELLLHRLVVRCTCEGHVLAVDRRDAVHRDEGRYQAPVNLPRRLLDERGIVSVIDVELGLVARGVAADDALLVGVLDVLDIELLVGANRLSWRSIVVVMAGVRLQWGTTVLRRCASGLCRTCWSQAVPRALQVQEIAVVNPNKIRCMTLSENTGDRWGPPRSRV